MNYEIWTRSTKIKSLKHVCWHMWNDNRKCEMNRILDEELSTKIYVQPWTKVNVFRLWLPALRHRRMLRINFLCVNTWFWTLYKLQLLCSDRSCYVLNNADILDQWLSILLWGIASILCCHMGNEARHVVSNLPRDSQSGWDQASREENQYNRCRCCVAMLETHSMCGTAMAKNKCISIFLLLVYCLLQTFSRSICAFESTTR